MGTMTGLNRRKRLAKWATCLTALACALVWAPAASAQSEIPAGARFLVELRDNLDARKVRAGKKFEARTLEPIQATDGNSIPTWAKLKGEVSYVRDNKMILRFERIATPSGEIPLVATVAGVVGEKDVKEKASEEGEIKASGHRGRDAAIGAVVLGGIGAAVGASQAGAKGAEIGAGAGGATGAVIGAVAGGRDLVLHKGTRTELQLDRPLMFRTRR